MMSQGYFRTFHGALEDLRGSLGDSRWPVGVLRGVPMGFKVGPGCLREIQGGIRGSQEV